MPRLAGMIATCPDCRFPSARLVGKGESGPVYVCQVCGSKFQHERFLVPKCNVRRADGEISRFDPSILINSLVPAIRKTNRLHPVFRDAVPPKEESSWAYSPARQISRGAIERVFHCYAVLQGSEELESSIVVAAALNAIKERGTGEWEVPCLTAALKFALHRPMFSVSSSIAQDVLLGRLKEDRPRVSSEMLVSSPTQDPNIFGFFLCPVCGKRVRMISSRRIGRQNAGWKRVAHCTQCDMLIQVTDETDQPLGVVVDESSSRLAFNMERFQRGISAALQDSRLRSQEELEYRAGFFAWEAIHEASLWSTDWTVSQKMLSWAAVSVLEKRDKLAAIRYIVYSGRFHEFGRYNIRELLDLVDREVYAPYYAEYAKRGLVPASLFGEWPTKD